MKLDERDRDVIIKSYTDRLIANGPCLETIGTDQKRNNTVYATILQAGIKKEHTVREWGCGVGHFYRYLFETIGFLPENYIGHDIVPKFVEFAKHILPPEVTIILENGEIGLDFGALVKCPETDWVVATGVFNNNYKYTDNEKYVMEFMRTMFSSCRKGLVIDFMSAHHCKRRAYLHYYLPEAMLKFAQKSLSKRVILRHDYLPSEFMMYVIKES